MKEPPFEYYGGERAGRAQSPREASGRTVGLRGFWCPSSSGAWLPAGRARPAACTHTGQTAADCHFALQDTSFFAAASDCLVIKTTPAAATPEEAFESFESGEEGSGEVDDGSDEVLSAVPKTTAPEFTGTQESPTLATAKTEDIVDAEEVDY